MLSQKMVHQGPCLVGLNLPVQCPPVQSGLRRTRHLVYFLVISFAIVDILQCRSHVYSLFRQNITPMLSVMYLPVKQAPH